MIMMVRMPSARISANLAAMPGLTVSLRWMTPRTRLPSATTSGVPPLLAMRFGHRGQVRGRPDPLEPPPSAARSRPRLYGWSDRPHSIPDIRVWAVKGTRTPRRSMSTGVSP